MKGLRCFMLAALSAALFFLTRPAWAQCPPDDPECAIPPPLSQEVDPGGRAAAGELVIVSAPGALPGLAPSLPISLGDPESWEHTTRPGSAQHDLPPSFGQVLENDGQRAVTPPFQTLDVRMRYQTSEPGDATCGVQALGMAMEGQGTAPGSSELADFLRGKSMLYDFGTGVEELAYAAVHFGYGESSPFHSGLMDHLREEIVNGRPAVVALGGGEGRVGHFVTVTGFSSDGQWVAYNDPALGEQVLPAGVFDDLWADQGRSGVWVRPQAFAALGNLTPAWQNTGEG